VTVLAALRPVLVRREREHLEKLLHAVARAPAHAAILSPARTATCVLVAVLRRLRRKRTAPVSAGKRGRP